MLRVCMLGNVLKNLENSEKVGWQIMWNYTAFSTTAIKFDTTSLPIRSLFIHTFFSQLLI